MDCDELRELLPAYVLGALDAEELAAVEEHLRAGREHDDELVELRATVFALDRLVGDVATSGMRVTDVPRDRGRRAHLAGMGRFSRIASSRVGRGIAAAVVVLLTFGAGWFGGQLLTGEGQAFSYAVQGQNGRLVELSGETSEDSVTVWMAGFERLPPEREYQIWAIRDGKWLSIGVCNTNAEGRWRGEFAFSAQPDEQFALTIEPAGGSPRPTSEPILQARR